MAAAQLGRLVAWIANRLLWLLRGREDLRLDREEFRFSKVTFAQSGEDLAVIRWLQSFDAPHRFIDAGCFDPAHGSNTVLLSKQGWTGVNIDMSPERIEAFRRRRPQDSNVVAALSDAERDMTRFSYQSSFTDRLGAPEETDLLSLIGEAPKASEPVKTTTLDAVLDANGFPEGPFGYLNIDCEGQDLKVLRGFDLERRPPAVITVEAISRADREELIEHLAKHGYALEEILFRTLLFVRCRS
jgi:FkbM family methyltransferase